MHLRKSHNITAEDAMIHPDTKEFKDSYTHTRWNTINDGCSNLASRRYGWCAMS